MNATQRQRLISRSPSLGVKAAGLLFCLLFVRAAFGQLYVNNQNEYYQEPGPPAPPEINDTAFDNQNVFSVTYTTWVNNNVQFCEPWIGTLFWTNNGEMMVNAPIPPEPFFFYTTGVGFEFDTAEGNSNVMAGTFYNPGTVHCDSVLDGNNLFTIDAEQLFIPASIGECKVSATNIIVPGTIEIGIDGLLNLSGQTVNLNRSVLTMETGENAGNIADNGFFAGTGVFGLNTNYWDPSVYLTPVTAASAYFPLAPNYLILTNSTSYYQEVPTFILNSNIVRCAFVQNTSPTNVTYNVYFDTSDIGLGPGDVTIGWMGTYFNYATGLYVTNYLYLNDWYSWGASTNVALNDDGYPDNFTITESTVPLISLTATPPGFPGFPSGAISNYYAYASVSSSYSAATNSTSQNPSGALTNLPDKIQITASRELNVNLAQISGPVYMSLTSTNQFDYSGDAQIQTPFADINLGVTNGYMTISNLLQALIPDWGGTIQAWTTRFIEDDPDQAATNDYRVLLVNSDLTPTIGPEIQNLTLNATNLVISDVLNVFGSVYATPQSLTLTTNISGRGASSPDGELNLTSPNNINWNASFPWLLLLTNNGALRIANYADFVSTTQAVVVTPGIPAMPATNMLVELNLAKNLANGNTVTLGADTYVFSNSISAQSPADVVKIGANFDGSMNNLIAAVDGAAGSGTAYSSATYSNTVAFAGPLANHAFTATAFIPGTAGNYIPTTINTTNLIWTNGPTLAGGAAAVPGATNTSSGAAPYIAFINNSWISDQGATLWTGNFLNGGVFSNGVGFFDLNAVTATITNSLLEAGGDVSIMANTLLASNLTLQAGRALELQVTNWLWDGVTNGTIGLTNGNLWSVGSTNATGFDGLGLVLPFLPTNTTPQTNNLLGTTIFMQSPPPNKEVSSTWAATDYGASTLGYTTNNVAVGQLALNSLGPNCTFYFTGPTTGVPPGASNAIYVDRIILLNYASYTNFESLDGGNVDPAVSFNTTLPGSFTIYYADALANGSAGAVPFTFEGTTYYCYDVSTELNGANGGHFQLVTNFTSYFNSTNSLSFSGPVLTSGQIKFAGRLASRQPSYTLTWCSLPGATNSVLYKTNLMSPNWLVWTNFVSPTNAPPISGSAITNTLLVPILQGSQRFYRVSVTPN